MKEQKSYNAYPQSTMELNQKSITQSLLENLKLWGDLQSYF